MDRDGGSLLAVGTNHCAIQLWDAAKLAQVCMYFEEYIGFLFPGRLTGRVTSRGSGRVGFGSNRGTWKPLGPNRSDP